MQVRIIFPCFLMVVVMLIFANVAKADSAAKLFEQGKKALADSDFETALSSFAGAAKADKSNKEYAAQYMMTRRIVQLRQQMKSQRDPKRWQYMAEALRAFYVSEEMYLEALALDQEVYEKLQTADAAVNYAETLLAMAENAEAAKVLRSLKAHATPASEALLGVALARDGKLADAKRIAKRFELPEDATPGTKYSAARLFAAVGDTEAACDQLAKCFEAIAPSRLDGFRSHAKICPDFAKMTKTASFAKALATQSKVAESKCSGASKCAGCPMRGNCEKK